MSLSHICGHLLSASYSRRKFLRQCRFMGKARVLELDPEGKQALPLVRGMTLAQLEPFRVSTSLALPWRGEEHSTTWSPADPRSHLGSGLTSSGTPGMCRIWFGFWSAPL